MIDEKKIEEAARKYAFNKYDSTDDEVEDTYTEELQMAFEAGINWFLDNLWHGFDEVPRNDYSQVVLIRGNNQALPTILDMNELMVGERVTIILEVVEESSCYGCFFRTSFGKCNGDGKVKCSIRDRSDGKSVIFKEVKE